MVKTCAVDECDRKAVARGMCTMHYQRACRGTPMNAPPKARHGFKSRRERPPEYEAWAAMRFRCYSTKSPNWSYYGGRGITVCDRWRSSFEAFFEDMGRRPSELHTLDRIDVNGNYEPGNCRWATRAEQSRNRRPFTVDGRKHPLAKVIAHDGVTDTIAGWARRMGVRRELIRGRLKRGWDPVRAVTEPPDPEHPKTIAASRRSA